MNPPTKRRWFAYSLRMPFVVVTVFGCWLGYELNWIRQRKEFRIKHMAERQKYDPEEHGTWDWVEHALPDKTAPFPLSYFGEVGEVEIAILTDATKPDQVTTADKLRRRHVQALFPEAVIDFLYWGRGDDLSEEPGFWIMDHRDVPNLDY